MMVDSEEQQLERVSEQIKPSGNLEVLIYPVDLTHRDSPYELFTFCRECEIDVEVLINCVRDGSHGNLYIGNIETLASHLSNLMTENRSGHIVNIVSTSCGGIGFIRRSCHHLPNIVTASVMASCSSDSKVVERSLAGRGIIAIGLCAKIYLSLLYHLPLYVEYNWKRLKKATRR